MGEPAMAASPARCRPIPAAVERLVALRGMAGVSTPGESRPGGLSRGDRRHVGRRSAARKASCAARPSCIPMHAHRLQRAARFPAATTTTTACWASAATARCCFSPAQAGQTPGRLDDWMRNKLQPTPTDIQSTEIGGAEAAIGARPRGSDTGLPGALRHHPAARRHLLFQPVERRARPRPAHQHAMVEADAQLPRPDRRRRRRRCGPIACASCRAAAPRPSGLPPRMPYPDFKLERLLTC